jgi:branched-chain amino acid transport system permease protein
MWIMPFAKAFTIVILGGLGSIEGSILAALILGYSETIVSFAISSRVTELVAMFILFLVIIFRPSGLMGSKVEV